MKLYCSLLAAAICLSCSDSKEKPVVNTTPARETPITKDVNPFSQVDVSPMDMSYYPVDYPKLKISGAVNTGPFARVIYSRPHRQGRQVFGSLVKYGEPWRLGANEATEIEFFVPAVIQGQKVARGRYMMYAIPQADQWTVVLNSNTFSWGLKIDASKDVHRFQVNAENTNINIESFTISFEQGTSGANLLMAWDHIVARLPIQF